MKKLFGLLLVSLFLANVALAQGYYGYKWKSYELENKQFEMNFPAIPQKRSAKSQVGGVVVNTNIYVAKDNLQNYAVQYVDLKNRTNDKETVNKILDSWLEQFAKGFKNGERTDSEVKFKNYDARKFKIVGKDRVAKGYAFHSFGRLFFMFSTHINSKYFGEISEKYNKYTTDFFNSFSLLKERAAKTKNGQTYKNKYFDFELSLPTDWHIVVEDDSESLAKGGNDEKFMFDSSGSITLKSFINGSNLLFHYTKNNPSSTLNTLLTGVAEKISTTEISDKKIAKAYQKKFKKEGYKIVSKAQKVSVDGKTYYRLKMSKSGNNGVIWQEVYMRKQGNLLLQVVMSSSDEDELKLFQQVL